MKTGCLLIPLTVTWDRPVPANTAGSDPTVHAAGHQRAPALRPVTATGRSVQLDSPARLDLLSVCPRQPEQKLCQLWGGAARACTNLTLARLFGGTHGIHPTNKSEHIWPASCVAHSGNASAAGCYRQPTPFLRGLCLWKWSVMMMAGFSFDGKNWPACREHIVQMLSHCIAEINRIHRLATMKFSSEAIRSSNIYMSVLRS